MQVCPSWLSFILYNPVRKAFTDRTKVLNESCITENSIALEIGSGNGFFTEAIAGVAKKVYAVELQKGMVKKLNKRIKRFGDKVEIMLGDAAVHDLGNERADVCLMYYSFHEISSQQEAALNIAKAVKSGGVLAIYEPSIEVNKKAMLKTIDMFESAGFIKEAERDGLFTRFARLRKQ